MHEIETYVESVCKERVQTSTELLWPTHQSHEAIHIVWNVEAVFPRGCLVEFSTGRILCTYS